MDSTLAVLKLDKSKDFTSQPEKTEIIFNTCDVSKFDTSNEVKEEHAANILVIYFNFGVLKLDISKYFNEEQKPNIC